MLAWVASSLNNDNVPNTLFRRLIVSLSVPNLPKVIVDAIAKKKGKTTKGGKRKPSPGLKRGYKCKK